MFPDTKSGTDFTWKQICDCSLEKKPFKPKFISTQAATIPQSTVTLALGHLLPMLKQLPTNTFTYKVSFKVTREISFS